MKLLRLIVLFIVFILFFKITTRLYHRKENTISQFQNKNTKSKFCDMLDKLGQPEIIFNSIGGFVVWSLVDKNNKKYGSVILKDENKTRFIYTTILFNPLNYSNNENVYYNTETSELTANGSSYDDCLNTLFDIIKKSVPEHKIDDRILERFGKERLQNNYKQIPVAP